MKNRASFFFLLAVLPVIVASSALSQDGSLNCDVPQISGQASRLRPMQSELEKYLQSIADPAHRKQAIEIRVGAWFKRDGRGVFTWAAALSNETVQAEVARYLVSLVDATNPGFAANFLRFVRLEAVRNDLLAEVLQLWMKTDWQAALSWSQQLPQSQLKEKALVHLSYRWLEVDPSAAMEYASSLGSCNSQLLATLTGQWAIHDPSAAAEWAANLSSAQQRKRVMPSLVAVWAQQSPEDAANFVINLPPDSTRDETVISVVSAWSRKDPQAVIAWLDEIPDSILKQQALRQISTIWASSDPQAAEEWLQNQMPGDARDAAITSYSTLVAHTSPTKAFEWAEQIQDESIRTRQLEFLGASWLRSDPTNAERAILQSSLADERKQELLKNTRSNNSRY